MVLREDLVGDAGGLIGVHWSFSKLDLLVTRKHLMGALCHLDLVNQRVEDLRRGDHELLGALLFGNLAVGGNHLGFESARDIGSQVIGPSAGGAQPRCERGALGWRGISRREVLWHEAASEEFESKTRITDR